MQDERFGPALFQQRTARGERNKKVSGDAPFGERIGDIKFIPDAAHNSVLELGWKTVAERILVWLKER